MYTQEKRYLSKKDKGTIIEEDHLWKHGITQLSASTATMQT